MLNFFPILSYVSTSKQERISTISLLIIDEREVCTSEISDQCFYLKQRFDVSIVQVEQAKLQWNINDKCKSREVKVTYRDRGF